MFGLMNHLNLTVCENPEEAAAKGFEYKRENGFAPVTVEKVVVVRNGTVNGNATVDFVLEDESGNKFVFVVTGNLLKAIPC